MDNGLQSGHYPVADVRSVRAPILYNGPKLLQLPRFYMAQLVRVILMALNAAACGGEISLHPTDGGGFSNDSQDGHDGSGDAKQDACDQPDPTLSCGTDGCGRAIVPFCRASLWVCPAIPLPATCLMDASLIDGGSASTGVPCPGLRGVSCAPGTFCEGDIGSVVCVPLPAQCKSPPACPCLLLRARQDNICLNGAGYFCEETDSGFLIACDGS